MRSIKVWTILSQALVFAFGFHSANAGGVPTEKSEKVKKLVDTHYEQFKKELGPHPFFTTREVEELFQGTMAELKGAGKKNSENVQFATSYLTERPEIANPCKKPAAPSEEPNDNPPPTEALSAAASAAAQVEAASQSQETCEIGEANIKQLKLLEKMKIEELSIAEAQNTDPSLSTPETGQPEGKAPEREQPKPSVGESIAAAPQDFDPRASEPPQPPIRNTRSIALSEEEISDPFRTRPQAKAGSGEVSEPSVKGVHGISSKPSEPEPAVLEPTMAGFAAADAKAQENLELVRQALNERVIRRDIEPETAQAILERIAPSLQQGENLEDALERAQNELARAQSQGPTSSEAEKPKVFAAVTESELGKALKKLESASSEKEADPTLALNSVLAALGLPGIPPPEAAVAQSSTKSDMLKALTAANAPVPAGNGTPELPLKTALNALADKTMAAAGSLFASPSGVASLPDTRALQNTKKKPQDSKKTSIDRFLDSVGKAFGSKQASREGLRAPASSAQGSADSIAHGLDGEATRALAGFTAPGPPRGHSAHNWMGVALFLASFLLPLGVAALWHQYKRRRKHPF